MLYLFIYLKGTSLSFLHYTSPPSYNDDNQSIHSTTSFEDRPSGCTQVVQHCEEYRRRSTVFHLPYTGPFMPSGVNGRKVVEPGGFGLVVV